MEWKTLDYFLLTVIVAFMVFNDARIKRVERQIKRTELYLKLILERLEIEAPSRLSERVKKIALEPGRKIEAIKLYREETGAELKEAKEVIEEFIDRNYYLGQ